VHIRDIQFHKDEFTFSPEGGRTKINKGTKRHTFVAFTPELTQTVAKRMYEILPKSSRKPLVVQLCAARYHEMFPL